MLRHVRRVKFSSSHVYARIVPPMQTDKNLFCVLKCVSFFLSSFVSGIYLFYVIQIDSRSKGGKKIVDFEIEPSFEVKEVNGMNMQHGGIENQFIFKFESLVNLALNVMLGDACHERFHQFYCRKIWTAFKCRHAKMFVTNVIKVPLWKCSKRKTFGIANRSLGMAIHFERRQRFDYLCIWLQFFRQKLWMCFCLQWKTKGEVRSGPITMHISPCNSNSVQSSSSLYPNTDLQCHWW